MKDYGCVQLSPQKPNSQFDNHRQQKFALGIHANPHGIKLAEAEARKIGALLDCKEFSLDTLFKRDIYGSHLWRLGGKIREGLFCKARSQPKNRNHMAKKLLRSFEASPS